MTAPAPVLRTRLSDDERTMISRLNSKLSKAAPRDGLHEAYFEGEHRLKQIGIAVPPELQMFELVVNWNRMYLLEIARRQKIKSLMMPGGKKKQNKALQEGYEVNNLSAEIPLLNIETMIYGRCFGTVSSNADDPDHPRLAFESPQQMSCQVDTRRRRMAAAFRQFRTEDGQRVGTLMLPDKTIQVVAGRRGWEIDTVGGDDDVDEHGLGRVPVVLFLNRRRLAKWDGGSEMTDLIPLVDAAARALTNLQIAVETHSVPQKWVLGMSKGDFVDNNGRPIPVWQAYYTAIWANQAKPDAVKVGQFSPSDLKNFHDTTNHYAALASSLTGLPFRFFGQNTANPAAEGAIRADESRLISNAEDKNEAQGVGIGWMMALYERFRTGKWPDGNRAIRVEWRNPATPTKAEEADFIQKLNGGTPVLSREGSWDEMGWDEARKDREREYFAIEAEDPLLERLTRPLTTGADDAADRVS
ncbi:phage portal protein [Rhodococcus sp. HM1]|uniref:phage portal protein n=1 Tax=Rhodococcus sp. HM1 TaxID=2937759 RepID=UPI00200B8550|nr:phage portal protein [Rhodococcus sp. HM1]MCK8670994.1 phage portal protein [Rhodococcus sp. HM1]